MQIKSVTWITTRLDRDYWQLNAIVSHVRSCIEQVERRCATDCRKVSSKIYIAYAGTNCMHKVNLGLIRNVGWHCVAAAAYALNVATLYEKC